MPILITMQWLLGSLTLVAVALLARHLLHMGVEEGSQHKLIGALSKELRPIYSPLAQEIETQLTILGITLNEAFGEHKAGRHVTSWHVIRLTRGEWERVRSLVSGLQNTAVKFIPTAQEVEIFRRIAVKNFKSRAVRDQVPMYEFLDQLSFGSRRRLGIQFRLLTKAGEALSKEFHRACREGERSLDASNELWNHMDVLFHDFDLIAKESLLAFRTLLCCQTLPQAEQLAVELQELLKRSTRVAVTAQSETLSR